MTVATSNQAAWQAMQSKLQAMTNVAAVVGEPTDPPADFTAVIIPSSGNIDETTLTTPREIHQVTIRFYVAALKEPKENTEFTLDHYRAQIQADIFGDFDLGGNVAYALPTQFAWQYGFQTVSQTLFRLLDLTVVYRIDDNATFAA